jgi:hypothetical protein
MDAEKPPKMIHGDIENVDLAEIGTFIESVAKAGMNVEPIAKQAITRAGFDLADDAEIMAPQPPQPGAGAGGQQPGSDLGQYPEGDYQQPSADQNDESAITATERNGKKTFVFSSPKSFSMPNNKSLVKTKDINATISALKRMRMDEAVALIHANKIEPPKK